MHVLYYAPFAQKTGYAQAAHDYMLALHRVGVSLEIQPLVKCNTDDLEERYEELIPLALNRSPVSKMTHVIMHTVPRAVPLLLSEIERRVPKIAITTWETARASLDIIEGLDASCDRVITPSGFCEEALQPERFPDDANPKFRVVPHCFDPEHWPIAETPPDDSPYSFYSVLGWNERKNPIGLLKAYLSEFTSDDDVILRLKVSGYSEDDLRALIQATGISIEKLPALEIVTDYYDHEDMVDFHHRNHCFVTAARGEGWNLPAFEAALCGRPVISPSFGGQMEYLHDYVNMFRFGCQMTPAIVPPTVTPSMEIAGLQVSAVNQVAPSGITAHQQWAEPDLCELAELMRGRYERRTPVDNSSRQAFEDRFGYDTVGAQLAKAIS